MERSIDGTGAPPRPGDVAYRTAGSLPWDAISAPAAREIDAAGSP